MISTCERCGVSGPVKATPCRTCRGGHALCEQCRETFDFFFCEGWCFWADPIQSDTGTGICQWQ